METTDSEYIKGYENLYKIDKNGNVYSCLYNKIMTPQIKYDGYLFLSLSKNKTRKKCFIHRLVALQWIPNHDNLPEVDHIDRTTNNNNIENLRWVTRITNRCNQDRYDENRKPEVIKQKKEDMTTYKREWAEKNRRAKGCLLKSEQTKTKDPDYYNKWQREKRASLTPDEREEKLKARRAAYHLKKLNN